MPHPARHVTRLSSPEERREVANEIAAAAKARHAAATPASVPSPTPAPPPSAQPALPAADAQTIVTPLRDAMREALPLLAECYTKALPTLANSRLSVAAHLRLTGDPDVGTLIDADQLYDDVDKSGERPTRSAAAGGAKVVDKSGERPTRSAAAGGAKVDDKSGERPTRSAAEGGAKVVDKPLPSELDSCLRDTLQQLELPPLAEGDKIDVTYPLAFSSD